MWEATLIFHPQKTICTALSDFDSIYNVLMLMFINYYSTIHEHIFDFRKYFMVTLACTCTFLRKHGAQPVISNDFENVEKSCTVCPLSHSVRTVLRDPLSYATFSIRSLEESHMTVWTVLWNQSKLSFIGPRQMDHYTFWESCRSFCSMSHLCFSCFNSASILAPSSFNCW